VADNYKTGFVSIIGRPNVGKSTLMNHLIGQKIAIMSNKPQTTRNKIHTIISSEKGQIIFIDTPGIHMAKSKLGTYMNKAATGTIRDVDVIMWLVEPDKRIGVLDRNILSILEGAKVPVILVINKIDTISREEILTVINTYKDAYDFAEIIPVSALKGDNTEHLTETLYGFMEEGPQFYPDDMITDQPERQIMAELIREKILHLMEQEIPHGIAVVIDQVETGENGKTLHVDATIICEKDSHKGMVIGKQGSMLKRVGTMARQDIERLLGSKVNLKLWVKVKKNWRDSDYLMRNFGFHKDEF
jgi:GTP-binding protein Era